MLMLVMFRTVFPVLVSVTVCGKLLVPTFCSPNVKAVGARLTTVPVPNRAITCGFADALSLIEIVPLAVPRIVGTKLMVIAHFAPGPRLELQVLVRLNGPEGMIAEI